MLPTTPPSDKGDCLPRQLTLAGIWLLVVNGTIGAGIFGVPAGAARLTGAFSPWMFVTTALLIAPIVLTFAEIGSYFRGTGGPVMYTHTAYGPLLGFQAGWALYVARVTSFAANTNLLVSAVAYFWVGADRGAVRILLLFVVCAALTWNNVTGAKGAIRSLGVLTVLKLFPLLLLVLVGLPRIDTAILTDTTRVLPPLRDFGAASLLIIYAYMGWEIALVPAGEARDPTRDMPRALLRGIGIVAVLYLAIQVVTVSTLPGLAGSERPLVEAAAGMLGPIGALILTVGVITSVGGNLASAVFTAPRLTFALARDGSLPGRFASVHPRYRTPAFAILVYGAVAFALAAYGTFTGLALVSSLTRILTYMACIVAVPRLRARFGGLPERFRLPGGYLIPALALGVTIWLAAQADAKTLLATMVFLVVGSVLYVLARRAGTRSGAMPTGG